MSFVPPQKRLKQTCISFKGRQYSKCVEMLIEYTHVIHSVIVLICYVMWQTGRYGHYFFFILGRVVD